MNIDDIKLWNNITFKTQGYRKNFDFVNDNENIITEYEGYIAETNISEQKMPTHVGEYGFSVWNIKLAKKFKININKLITDHSIEDSYKELKSVLAKKELDLNNIDKLIIIHNLFIQKKYRKRGITEEFVEMMYRDFYCDNNKILILVKPFQDNLIDFDFFVNHRNIEIKTTPRSKEIIKINAFDYYELNEFLDKKDIEINEYKLFTIANRCGFNRLNDSYLFIYSPDNTIKRMEEKINFINNNKIIL